MSSGGARRKEKGGKPRRDRQKQYSEGFKQDSYTADTQSDEGETIVLSTSLRKTFFAWRFILNETILF